MDYSALEPGSKISDRTYRLDAGTVERYLLAVGDQSGLFAGEGQEALSPPMAVAAQSLRGVVKDLGIPPGSLHTGQEVQFRGSVRVGETLRCLATISRNSVRGEWRFIDVQLAVDDGKGRRVMTGKSSIVLPVNGGGA